MHRGRRPRREILVHAPPVGAGVRRRPHAGPQPLLGPGVPRPRPLRLRGEPLVRLLDGVQGGLGHGGELGLGARRPAPPPVHRTGRLRASRGRPQHRRRVPADSLRAAPPRAEAPRGPRLRPREPGGPGGHRGAPPPHRNRHRRQGVPRPPPGPRRPRDRRGDGGGDRDLGLEARPHLADRAGGGHPLRGGARRAHRGRGEAGVHRGPVDAPLLQPRGRAGAHRREARRGRRAPRPGAGGALRGHRRPRPRGPAPAPRRAGGGGRGARPPPRPAPRPGRPDRGAGGEGGLDPLALAVLLLGLPPQHLDPRPRRLAGDGRDRLSRDGDVPPRAAHVLRDPHGRGRE